MSALRFDIPPYEMAMHEFFSEVMHHFRRLDQLLGSVPWTTTEHDGPIRNVTEPVLDQAMRHIEGHAALSLDAVRHTRVDHFTAFLAEIAETYTQELGRDMIRNIGEITSAIGNVFNATDTPLTFDTFLDMLDRMPMDFDEDGNAQMPTVIIPPQLTKVIKSWQLTPAQLQRRDEIIRRKRAEFDAAKRTRRLS